MKITEAESMLSDIRVGLSLREVSYVRFPEKISGGYDTGTYRFQLDHVPTRLSHQLVTKSFPSINDSHRAFREAAVQNVLASEGLPVPEVHLTIAEPLFCSTPFLVMDYVAGETLLEMEEPESSLVLGKAHARLHQHNAAAVTAKLERLGIQDIFLPDLLRRIETTGRGFPWANRLVAWLKKNRVSEGTQSICHGDFHKLNILQKQGQITGILDWSNFAVLEAAFDIANTMISFQIVAKHLTARGDFDPVDLEAVVNHYLDAYKSEHAIRDANLNYYFVLRSTMILLLAALKVAKPYQHPLVVSDLCELIEKYSGIAITRSDITGDRGV